MATTTETKLLTADDLLRLDAQGVRGELIRGALYETMPPGGEHGIIVSITNALIWNFVTPLGLGWVTSEVGVWLEREPDTVRGPDVAFFSHERWPQDVPIRSYVDVIPDLAVEVNSPNDSRRETDEKARMWRDYGVRLVWAMFPGTRTVNVYRADGTMATLGDCDALDGGDVLPGFTCEVSQLFPF